MRSQGYSGVEGVGVHTAGRSFWTGWLWPLPGSPGANCVALGKTFNLSEPVSSSVRWGGNSRAG